MAYQSEIEKLEARFREKPEQWFAALADAYRKSGDVEMALEVLHAWIDKRPNYSSGNIVLGRCLLEQGKFDEAVGAFERVLALDMENIIALKSMGEIAEKRGDADGAMEWLKRLLEADPMNDEAKHALERIEQGGLVPAAPPQAVEAAPEPEPAVAETTTTEVAELEPAEVAEPGAEEHEAPAEPAPAEVAIEDIAAIAEQDTVPFEASAPPPEFGAALTEEQAAAAEQAGDATLPDLEPMEFGGAADDEPAPLEGLEPAGLEETLVEMPPLRLAKTVDEMAETPMPAHLMPSAEDAEDTLVETPAQDLTLMEPEPEGARSEPPPSSVAQDNVEFVEQSEEEADGPAEAPVPVVDAGLRPELPLILPEEVEPDLDEPVLDEPSIREPEPVVTETMAELYVAQGLFGEAVDIYEQLLARAPGDVRFEKRLEEVREKAEGETAHAAPSRHDRYASDRTGGVSVRQLFADLAAGPVVSAVAAATQVTVEEAPPSAAPEARAPGDFSFDQYFGSGGEAKEADAKPEAEPQAPGGSQTNQNGGFQDWLKGLKS